MKSIESEKAINNQEMYNPSQISTGDFMNSIFQNSECETILRNIVMLQKSSDPSEWTPFSWEDYVEFCTHKVTRLEKSVLDAFVNGGKPVSNTTAYLTPGWLSFQDGCYSFTGKMIEMLGRNYSK